MREIERDRKKESETEKEREKDRERARERKRKREGGDQKAKHVKVRDPLVFSFVLILSDRPRSYTPPLTMPAPGSSE